MMASGVYDVPKIDFGVVPVATNTTPTGPYRGAGRPEAAAHRGARGRHARPRPRLDPVELRRRNFIAPDRFPHTTATGVTYDSGAYAIALDEALRLAGYDDLREEQRGRGAPIPMHRCSASASRATWRRRAVAASSGRCEVHDDGTVTAVTGSVPQGQGHETTWAQIVSATLGVPSRHGARGALRHRARRPRRGHVRLAFAAARRLGGARGGGRGAGPGARAGRRRCSRRRPTTSCVLDDGRLGRRRRPRERHLLGRGRAGGDAARRDRSSTRSTSTPPGSFPFGAHVAVVEIDRETGGTTLRDMVAVDDCGVVVNPLLAEGQVHGGLAEGVAQILFEGSSTTSTVRPEPRACSTTSCPGPRSSRRSAPRTPSRRAPTTRSAPRASASRARRVRSRRCGTRWSTHWRRSASSTSTPRAHPSGSGGRSCAAEPDEHQSRRRRARQSANARCGAKDGG